MTRNSFDIIDQYINGEKIIMKYEQDKPEVFQYNLDRLPEKRSVSSKYATSDNSAAIMIADPLNDMCVDMRMSTGCKIAIALHWLNLLNDNTDVVVLVSPEHISQDAWNDSDFTDLIVYDCADDPAPCEPLIPRKSFLVGKNASTSFVKWNGSLTDHLAPVLAEAARIKGARDLKIALAGINVMLSDPDYSTAMKGDTLPKCAAALSMLSFGKLTLEYRGFSCEETPARCVPPDDFHDELAEHMSESAEILKDLLDIWKHYAEFSPIKFSFPFEMVMSRPQAIKDVANAIGIEDAVKAYLSGVPLADVLA